MRPRACERDHERIATLLRRELAVLADRVAEAGLLALELSTVRLGIAPRCDIFLLSLRRGLFVVSMNASFPYELEVNQREAPLTLPDMMLEVLKLLLWSKRRCQKSRTIATLMPTKRTKPVIA